MVVTNHFFFFYWIWGLIHRRNFTPGNAKLGQKIILGTAKALGPEPTIVMLNCHVVKLPSITLMPIFNAHSTAFPFDQELLLLFFSVMGNS